MGELELSSVTDTYPRALATDVPSIGAERAIVRTRHGLDLVPRYDLASAPAVDRLLLPGQPEAAGAAGLAGLAAARLGRPVERIHAGGRYPYDLTLTDLARQETRLIARNAARWIEYPTTHLALGEHNWSLPLLARAVALGALGLLAALALHRRRRARPSLTSPAAEPRTT